MRIQELEQYNDTLVSLDVELDEGDVGDLFQDPAFALRYRLDKTLRTLYCNVNRFGSPFGYQLKRAEGGGEALERATGAVSDMGREAQAAGAGVIPTVGHWIHQGVYSSFYYVTYGVVFGALLIGSWIPSNNAMGDGVRDGARDGAQAARSMFEGGLRSVDMEEGAVTG